MTKNINSLPLSQHIQSFNSDYQSYTSLIDDMADAQLILMGEATHGTHEFYRIRCELTKILIQEKGFSALAIEADWPDAYLLNQYVKNNDPSLDEKSAFKNFDVFPSWMWRNGEMIKFIQWLRTYNDQINEQKFKAGLYGLDIYSLHASMKLVIEYLKKIDPKAAKEAQKRYECLDQYANDPTSYSYAITSGLVPDCKEEVYDQLIDILNMEIKTYHKPETSQEELLFLTQNAKVVANAEAYYRSLFNGPEITWNLRAKHMMDTLETLRIYHQRTIGYTPKMIIWAHNIHVGDARATDLFQRGKISMGQLSRDHYGNKSYLLGFTTFDGEVTAASSWGGNTERKKLRPAVEGSYEYLFHQLNTPSFSLQLHENVPLVQRALQRSIGVIYKPEIESLSHYHYTNLAQQFNTIIHIDTTTALRPLTIPKSWNGGDLPNTFPSGL